MSRQYNTNIINSAIQRALNITRHDALKKVEKSKNERVTFAITYHLQLPSISSILNKHWKTMTKDPRITRITKIFQKPPMVALKQPSNLKKMLCHAELPAQRQRDWDEKMQPRWLYNMPLHPLF